MRGKILAILAISGLFLRGMVRCTPTVTYTLTTYIESPQEGDTVFGRVTIKAKVVGTDQLQFLTFTVDGEIIGNVDSPPYEIVWDTEQTGDGWHVLRVEAHGEHITDYSDTVSVYVKNTYPVAPPSEVALSSENNGLWVRISWSPVDSADGYIIQYRALGDSVWMLIATMQSAQETTFVHDPDLHVGDYRVFSFKNDELSMPSEIVTTVPVATETIELRELNLGGNSGYGWDRINGTGSSYPMFYPVNAAVVDFYFTNLRSDYSTPPFYIASPSYSRMSLDSIMVPGAAWRDNGIRWVQRDTAAFLLPDTGYTTHEEAAENAFYGVKTQDGYYGLIYIQDIDTTAGELRLRTWFQKVRGLRLLERDDSTSKD